MTETGETLRTLVIVNPESGGGAAGWARPHVGALLRKHGVQATFVESRSTEHVTELARGAAAKGCDVLAVLGGDGTLHHAVNAAHTSDLKFAIFPAGSGNDIARGLGIPLDALAATEHFLRVIARGGQRAIDLPIMCVADGSEHVFLAAGGMGLDALSAHMVNNRFKPLPGAVRYVAAALWALCEFQPFEMDVQLDDAPAFRFGPALFAAVANGPVYGSGVCIAPTAQMDDGILELTLIPQLPLLRVLEALPIVLTSGNLRWPEIRRERARQVRIRPLRTGGPIYFHGDGEVLGEAPVEITVLPRALRLLG